MKKILVVDESVAVRETLALILGREFLVVHRPLGARQKLTESDEQVDLLILGLSPLWTSESATLVQSVAAAPYAVLFLVDSRSTLPLPDRQNPNRIDCLAKPFNPYELKEKVGRLLSGQRSVVLPVRSVDLRPGRAGRYLEFPYVSRPASVLAQRYALSRLPILIYGETGCGQESVARGIYEVEKAQGPWVSLSCAALTDRGYVRELGQFLDSRGERGLQVTLFLNHVGTLDPSAQASLLRCLEEEEDRGRAFRMLSAARADLLEQVYRGEFLDALYYRLASLTLYLAPLRERRDEIPALAARVARDCGDSLGLGSVLLAQDAVERLSNYLWFGNLREMETLMARTLATRRKTLVAANDLIFAHPGEAELPQISQAEEEPDDAEEKNLPQRQQEDKRTASTGILNGGSVDLSLVVNELAHELKNPMVTIKTFSQLLGDRYDDPVFRSRFREMVSGDIERMDDLLENLLDFSRLGQPVQKPVSLLEQLRYVLAGVLPESSQRWINEQLTSIGEDTDVFVDPEHLCYALKSVVRAAQFEAKHRGEVDIHTEGEGTIVISYANEGGRVLPLHQYLQPSPRSSDMDEEGMPLRVILAKALIEKNGGKIKMERDDTGGVQVRVELPLAYPQARKL